MRLIQWLILGVITLTFYSAAKSEETSEPKENDYKVARHYGYLKSDVWDAYLEKKSSVDINKLNKEIEARLKGTDFDRALVIEETMDALIGRAVLVLSYEGHHKLADDISYEYEQFYRFALTRNLLGIDEIGDHPPMSEWLDEIHQKIHDALGDMLCQYFRFHDIHILNRGIPVVMRPGLYDLKDYKDHFAGHLIFGWWFEHHGVAGVAAYWLVDGACIAGSYGLGIIVFVCSPIASLAEKVMDKHIAPPIAERIWNRAQEQY